MPWTTGNASVLYATLAALTLSGCDLDVTNFGVIPDENLDDPGIHAEIVRGAELYQAWAVMTVGVRSAIVSKEVTLSGIVLQGTQVIYIAQGTLDPIETNNSWTRAHEARFLAEHAFERVKGSLSAGELASSGIAAKAALLAGYANRLLGEHMCYSVFDGGPAGSHEQHFDRAQDYFTNAYQIATTAGDQAIQVAALAGRASVRIWSDDPQQWTAAVEDAQRVPLDFVYQQGYNDHANSQMNWWFEGNRNLPFRDNSAWNTFYEDYFTNTADPRVSWEIVPEAPFGTIGSVPWYPPRKYTSRTSPINLSSGREMQLVIAEAKLRAGAWEEALDIINSLRVAVPVEPWDASSLQEAWTALKRERGIELWLEGRRLPDLRRWDTQGAPGEAEDMTGRSLCHPIGISEVETNPNINS
jgi:starch-binding outer membrane protein, SusD/RagB family